MLLKRFLIATLIVSSFESIQAMNRGGGAQDPAMQAFIRNAINQNADSPEFQALIGNAILANAQNPQLRAVFGDILINNAAGMVRGVISDPETLGQLKETAIQWFSDFTASAAAKPEDTKKLLDSVKQEVLDFITDKAGWGFRQFQAFRKKHGNDGMVGQVLGFIEQAIWKRKSFPLSGDPQLKDGFTLQDWSAACYQGRLQVIQTFLRNDAYAHLLDVPDGDNRALSNAAFGYIHGEIEGVIPPIDGFEALVKDPRIESKFLIKAGLSSIPFDEWLLFEASYPQDGAKQDRLNELKALLRPTLSRDRLNALNDIRDRKESERKAQEKLIADRKAHKFNKASAIVGALTAVAGIYYFYYYSKNGALATPERPGGKVAAA